MYASVYPIRRLPAQAVFYDYSNEVKAAPGDLVEIKFKGQLVRGIVKSVHSNKIYERYEPVVSVLKRKLYNQTNLSLLELLSDIIIQSPGSILNVAFQAHKKNLPKNATTALSYNSEQISAISNHAANSFVGPQNLWALLIAARVSHADGQSLIVCPNENLAIWLFDQLKARMSVDLLCGKYASESSYDLSARWADGRSSILITTRQVCLWPAKKLQRIFLVDPINPDYQFLKRNPRISVPDLARYVAKANDASLIELGHSLSLQSLDNLTTANFDATFLPTHESLPNRAPFTTNTLEAKMDQVLAAKQRVLIYYNRSGVAKELQCQVCGHVPVCGRCGSRPQLRTDDLICNTCSNEMWWPKKCPACQSEKMQIKGIGIDRVLTQMRKIWPDNSIEFHKGGGSPTGEIVLVTEKGFRDLELQPLQGFGLVVDLCADLHLLDTHFAALENARYKVARTIHLAQSLKAQAIIQASEPDLIKKLFGVNWAKDELKTRQALKLPPFACHVIIDNSETAVFIDKNESLGYLQELKNHPKSPQITVIPQDYWL